jgi:hypothetical protein
VRRAGEKEESKTRRETSALGSVEQASVVCVVLASSRVQTNLKQKQKKERGEEVRYQNKHRKANKFVKKKK